MNGYVEKEAQKFLWIGKRSLVKPTYPGMLDQLVAGGLPHDISCGENLVKECEEEAGIPRSISKGAIPVSAISYVDIDGYIYKRDVLFCYDLKLLEDFMPKNQDGEVESFQLLPVTQVANVIRRTELFKSNCALVIMDFLFHHRSIKLTGNSSRSVSATTISGNSFTWNDVVRLSQPEFSADDSSDLRGYFEKIKICNRGSELQSEFLPFVLEGHVVGYIHNRFVNHLRRFDDVFVCAENNGSQFDSHVTLNSKLKTSDERTRVVGDVVNCLGEEELIPGIRNELYPVTSSFRAPIFLSLERAAAPYFGIKAYGVHMNGYVEKEGQKFLWIGKRSPVKPTYPGMLDHLVARGLPHDISCGENIVKECEEEAGIPRSISEGAIPVGAVSYMDIDGYRYKRDVLFCYDLKLPEDFVPKNQDGEVDSFQLLPVTQVANVIRRTEFFKPNCALVIMDFLFRHGYIHPECIGYLNLLQSLKSGDCS